MDRLYFLYAVDCEPLKDKSPACGGPSSWEASEKVEELGGSGVGGSVSVVAERRMPSRPSS